jgi:hypothetical protein
MFQKITLVDILTVISDHIVATVNLDTVVAFVIPSVAMMTSLSVMYRKE